MTRASASASGLVGHPVILYKFAVVPGMALALALAFGSGPAFAHASPPPATQSGQMPLQAQEAQQPQDDADEDFEPVNDPLEGFNRGVFAFNEAVDQAVLAPVAEGYRAVVPNIMQTWVGNFFGNIGDAWSVVNLVLQGKPVQGLEMTMRVATNTVLGFGGLLDIATEAGIQRRDEDFGQTLGYWGVPPGPYLVLPLLGPSQVRETAALPLDRGWSASAAFHHDADRIGIAALNLVDTRASLLSAGGVLDSIALDKYSFMRDAYVQRRQSLVYDGSPPEPTR
jgi:phospholipid-binding lipoprotein MlaA